MNMSKKKLLRAVEGKHHDRKPTYSRRRTVLVFEGEEYEMHPVPDPNCDHIPKKAALDDEIGCIRCGGWLGKGN